MTKIDKIDLSLEKSKNFIKKDRKKVIIFKLILIFCFIISLFSILINSYTVAIFTFIITMLFYILYRRAVTNLTVSMFFKKEVQKTKENLIKEIYC